MCAAVDAQLGRATLRDPSVIYFGFRHPRPARGVYRGECPLYINISLNINISLPCVSICTVMNDRLGRCTRPGF